jgi:hypothetical protein
MGLRQDENKNQNDMKPVIPPPSSSRPSSANDEMPGLYAPSPKSGRSTKSTIFNSPILSMPVNTPVQKICIGMGAAFIALGLIGFGIPTFFGAHLSAAHNWIHTLSGVAALWVGLRKSAYVANRFATIFGSVYGLLGLGGFIFGRPGLVSMPFIAESDRFLLPLIRGRLEFGTNDHVLHLIIGAVFLIPALNDSKRRKHEATKAYSETLSLRT